MSPSKYYSWDLIHLISLTHFRTDFTIFYDSHKLLIRFSLILDMVPFKCNYNFWEMTEIWIGSGGNRSGWCFAKNSLWNWKDIKNSLILSRQSTESLDLLISILSITNILLFNIFRCSVCWSPPRMWITFNRFSENF